MPIPKSKEQEFDKRVLINRTRPERCDKIITLYQLVRPKVKDDKDKEKSFFDRAMSGSCDRPYIVLPIPNSNMILLVASTLCTESNVYFHNQPIDKHYNASSLQCFKVHNAPPYRRHTKHCFNRHMNESSIEICGDANRFVMSLHLAVLTALVMILKSFIANV